MLRLLSWAPDGHVERTPEAAEALALQVASEAQAHPERFSDLARKYSDDIVTRDRGGSLGGVSGAFLPAAMLDALAALQPGQVSGVVATKMGFHIFLYRAPPPPAEVAGARIVIRYSSTMGGTASNRSRADALALAKDIVVKARMGADFAGLVRDFSEGADRVRNGGLGTWSTTNPLPLGVLVEVLAGLEVGEVSDPIDTPDGLQIVKRSAVELQQEFGGRFITLNYDASDTSAKTAASSREAVLAKATEIVARLQKDPTQFSQFQSTYCCEGTFRWSEGHGDPLLYTALTALAPNEISREPLSIHDSYVIAQRLDPSTLNDTQPTWGLPPPEPVDVESLMASNDGDHVASNVQEFNKALSTAPLSQGELDAVRKILDRMVADIRVRASKDGAGRVNSYRAALASLHHVLGEAHYGLVYNAINQFLARMIIDLPRL